MTGRRPPRVLVCDGSPRDAEVLQRALAHDDEIAVGGVFVTFDELLAALPSSGADLVVLDVERTGLEDTPAVSRAIRRLSVPVLIMSGDTGDSAARTAAALAAGALEALARHRLRLHDPAGPDAAMLRRTARRLAARTTPAPPAAGRRTERLPRPPAPPRRRATAPHHAVVVGICASTGGPGVLEDLLGELPAAYPVPILVVQHMSVGFTGGLVTLLDSRIALPVAIACHGSGAGPGVWFAPDDAHLTLTDDMQFALDRRTIVGPHRPSGDLLLTSLAEAAGKHAVGVVLTGMGRDGARGGAAVLAAGGLLLAQRPDDAAAYGMPRAAVAAGAQPLTVAEIASVLRNLVIAAA